MLLMAYAYEIRFVTFVCLSMLWHGFFSGSLEFKWPSCENMKKKKKKCESNWIFYEITCMQACTRQHSDKQLIHMIIPVWIGTSISIRIFVYLVRELSVADFFVVFYPFYVVTVCFTQVLRLLSFFIDDFRLCDRLTSLLQKVSSLWKIVAFLLLFLKHYHNCILLIIKKSKNRKLLLKNSSLWYKTHNTSKTLDLM